MYPSAAASAAVSLVSPNLRIATNGAYVVRTDWILSWSTRVWNPGVSSLSGHVEEAGHEIYVSLELFDQTTGQAWTPPTFYQPMVPLPPGSIQPIGHGYDNDSYILDRGSANWSFNRHVSLPFVVPMSAGDSYTLQILLSGSVFCWIANTPDTAHADLSVGGSGHPAMFEGAKLTRAS
ncbi:MAG: hypothetical protein L3K23_03425 [Thermoplasmata archaeon]|nr:hypothetical protein [Thermoplasmata archaeon]